MAKRLAYLPLFVRDFLSDPKVLLLDWDETAIYLRLLMLSWELGPLPDDPGRLSRAIDWGGPPGPVLTVLESCWVRSDAGWTSPRLEKERAYALGIVKANAERTAAATEARRKRDDQRDDQRSEVQPQAQAQEKREIPSSLRSEGRRARAPRSLQAEEAGRIPHGFPPEVWAEWVAHLWRRKKPTPQALESHRRKLGELLEARGEPAAVAFVRECIDANAQGIAAWAYERALYGTPGASGQPAREGVAERLARELHEAGIEVTP